MEKEYDIIGIGSPLLDIIVEVEEAVLFSHGLKKGEMHLVDSARSKSILESLQEHPKAYIPGGSAGNTVTGAALLGAKGLFLGVIGDDLHGKAYEEEMQRSGVATNLLRHEAAETGCAITFVTPDGERTFVTCLGAAQHLGKQHISEADIRKSRILHIEGYLLEDERTREAVIAAMDFAVGHGTLISVDLSAAWLITKNLAMIRDIVKKYVNIVFVNEDEAYAFTGKKEREALQVICDLCDIAVVKLGARGSLVQTEGRVYTIDPYAVEVVNTNGAGDMYAAGFLHGIARGQSIESAGKVGSHVAALVVNSPGARMHETHYHKLKDILKIYPVK
ncbi:MAG: adenosine kinase [bacterium]|nr:adenosine kinase [bacterium]